MAEIKQINGKAAMYYRKELGFSVVPLDATLTPMFNLRHYSDTLPSEAQTAAWWRMHVAANVGVMSGEVSNIMGLKMKGQSMLNAFEEITGCETENVPAILTSDGEVILIYRYHQALSKHYRRNELGIEIYSDKDYIIMPPSATANKMEYTWITGKEIYNYEIPQIPEKYVEYAIKCNDNLRFKKRSVKKSSFIMSFNAEYAYDSLKVLANVLAKDSRFHIGDIKDILGRIAGTCNPPISLDIVNVLANEVKEAKQVRINRITQTDIQVVIDELKKEKEPIVANELFARVGKKFSRMSFSNIIQRLKKDELILYIKDIRGIEKISLVEHLDEKDIVMPLYLPVDMGTDVFSSVHRDRFLWLYPDWHEHYYMPAALSILNSRSSNMIIYMRNDTKKLKRYLPPKLQKDLVILKYKNTGDISLVNNAFNMILDLDLTEVDYITYDAKNSIQFGCVMMFANCNDVAAFTNDILYRKTDKYHKIIYYNGDVMTVFHATQWKSNKSSSPVSATYETDENGKIIRLSGWHIDR